MYDRALYSRMVRFQRTAVENTFEILTTLQGHSDKIMKKSLEQMPWLPQGSKSTCIGLSDSCIDGSKNLRKIIVQGFDGVERLIAGPDTARKKNASSAAAAPSSPPPAAGPKQAVKRKAGAPQKSTPKAADLTPDEAEVKPKSQSAAGKPEETPPATGQAKSASPATSPPVPAAASSTAPAMPKPAEPSEKQTKSNTTPAGKPSS